MRGRWQRCEGLAIARGGGHGFAFECASLTLLTSDEGGSEEIVDIHCRWCRLDDAKANGEGATDELISKGDDDDRSDLCARSDLRA